MEDSLSIVSIVKTVGGLFYCFSFWNVIVDFKCFCNRVMSAIYLFGVEGLLKVEVYGQEMVSYRRSVDHLDVTQRQG